MNTKKMVIACLSIVLFSSCKDDKNNGKSGEPFVNMNTELLKNNYTKGESLELAVVPSEEMAIDSVVYYMNDHIIGRSKGTEKISFPLTDVKYGPQSLKSIAYSGGNAYESAMQIEVFPKNMNEEWTYTILNTYPHDIKAYTQGLEFHNHLLVESTGNGESPRTGNKGVSSIRLVQPKTGEVLKKVELDDRIFGEGATVLNGKIYQLTYKQNEAYVYDAQTLQKIKTLPYFQTMEGWGLTNDGTYLYMTDGSDKIYKLDPETFKLVDTIYVVSAKSTIPTINELEWVDGKIYANFYGSNLIGVIDPTSGQVEAVINFTGLLSLLSNHPDQDVFNGIAYNKDTKTFYVTGKNWDKMFEVKIEK